MLVPFKRKIHAAKAQASQTSIDPAAMSLLLQAFREVLVKRLRAGWGAEMEVFPEGRFLVALPAANAYVVGKNRGTSDPHVIVQAPSGTLSAASTDDLERIRACVPPEATPHVYTQASDECAPACHGIEVHTMKIDAIKLIPDLYHKARANRALLQALKHLGDHV